MPLNTDKIKALRERAGMSLQQAADAAGLSAKSHWHAIETGTHADVRISTLEAIAKALKVTARELIR